MSLVRHLLSGISSCAERAHSTGLTMQIRVLRGIREESIGKVIYLIAVIVAAFLIGKQIQDPTKRVIEAVVGIVFITLVARYPLIWSVSLFLVLYPFPFGLKVGSSNIVFLPILVVFWLIRVSTRMAERPIGSIVDKIIILMLISFIISFYNITSAVYMRAALSYTWSYITAIGFFYLIVNFVRDAESLRKLAFMGIISCFLVAVFCIIELVFGRVVIPGWLLTGHKRQLIMNIRINGPFNDYELLGEFFALNMPIIILFYVRSKRLLFKFAYFGLITLTSGLLLATATRGAFISLIFGVVYMLFVVRRDLNAVRLTAVIALAVGVAVVGDYIITNYTISSGMFERLFATKFYGLIPDTRRTVWAVAWQRAQEHIIIGHGPAWDFSKVLGKYMWPHCGYLFYLNVTGLIGLLIFVALLVKLLWATVKVKANSLYDKSFARALMMVLHVNLVIFIIDEIKIDYLRNPTYVYFIWYIFGLICATYHVAVSEVRNKNEKGKPPVPRRGVSFARSG